MRLLPSDPDIGTIVSRIKNGDIDLQPDFQRGEVWSRSKKQKLVDSILRDWHVPPIHVIEDIDSKKQEVLDGQQRLVAIRDFVDGEFSIDGYIEPFDPEINSLHGMKYRDLPQSFRRQFDQFGIRLFKIVDYQAGEPGELFFRLNQPTSLTGAEQRNAFFGKVRSQIKDLVEFLDEKGIGKDTLGFSNSRMAYDDVLARVAITLTRGTLNQKITSSDLVELYRSEEAIPQSVTELIKKTLEIISGRKNNDSGAKFNKATLYSWCLFVSRCLISGADWLTPWKFSLFLSYFESKRLLGALTNEPISDIMIPADWLFSIYESRSSSRVADVSSVLLRDAIIWIVFEDFLESLSPGNQQNFTTPKSSLLKNSFRPEATSFEDDLIARKLLDSGWGNIK
jgi:hypothetical protein